jgi:hypothetical protein
MRRGCDDRLEAADDRGDAASGLLSSDTQTLSPGSEGIGAVLATDSEATQPESGLHDFESDSAGAVFSARGIIVVVDAEER